MKTTLVSLLLPCAALLTVIPRSAADTPDTATEGEGFAPKGHPLSRYSHLDKKSPFEFDPPPPTREAAVDNFEGVSLGGYCGSGNTLSVYLITGKEKKRITVYGAGSPFKVLDQTGYNIIKLNEGKSLSTTTVLMEKDGQQKEIGFEKETLTAKGGGAGGGQVQMVPGPNGTMVPRPVIPRPSNAPAQTQAYQAPAPFIVGQSNAPAAPNPQAGVPQPVGNMSNQQLMNQLITTPNAPNVPNVPQFNNPAANPTGQPGGGPPVPQRRRVVLPTDSRR